MTLKCQNNRLTSLPESLYDLTNLISLNLRRNKLTYLSSSINNLQQLIHLDVSHNPIELPFITHSNLKLIT